jgi:uncharacterized protein (DUF433 family)
LVPQYQASRDGLIFGILRPTWYTYFVVSMALENLERVPLSVGSDGVIRVAGTRVTLDTVAETFREGSTPEEIIQQYPSLELADVYSVFGYMLRHPDEVAAYLGERAKNRSAIGEENERKFSSEGVRARLSARKA